MRRWLETFRYELGLLVAFFLVPTVLVGLMFVDVRRVLLSALVIALVVLGFRRWVR